MPKFSRKQKIESGYALVGLVILGMLVGGHISEASSASEASHMASRVRTAKAVNVHKKASAEHDLFTDATQDRDPVIRTIAINRDDNETIQPPFTAFFKTFYDWKNHDQYVARSGKLSGIATPNLLHDKRFFGSDTNASGGSIIDNKQLNSEFNSLQLYVTGHRGSNISVLADVQYDSWRSSTDNEATCERWFAMNYNAKAHKITSMKQVYADNDVTNNNN